MDDYNFNELINVDYKDMLSWTTKIFQACGMNNTDARLCADTLVMADARGVYSHGCMRTPIYCKRMLSGGTSPDARPEIVRKKGATALVEGNNAMGQVVTYYALQEAMQIAKEQGTATVAVRGSNHHGACAYYTMRAAEDDMIGFCWTMGGVSIMAPWGGADPLLGNNPFSMAAPCLTKPPVVLDMALSVVARGKLVMARKTNSPIPLTWALDQKGKPTSDPDAGYWGSVQPMGGYKGYVLSFLVTALTGPLPGAVWGKNVGDLYERTKDVQNIGHLLQVIDIAALADLKEFKTEMDELVDYVKSSRKIEGVEEIFAPGEPEAINLKRQLTNGISYPLEIIEENRELAKKLGVETAI